MNPFPNLPAKRTLGKLADSLPVVVVDTREQLPLRFTRLPSVGGSLTSGDYSVRGFEEAFAVERKTIADLVSCCTGENRERFFRELHRLRGFDFKRLLVVGTEEEIKRAEYRSRIAPAAVLGTLATIEVRFDVPVVFCESPEVAANRVEAWAWWYTREQVVALNALASAVGPAGDAAESDAQPLGGDSSVC